MKRDDFVELFQYEAWATARVLDAVAALPEEQYAKNLGSSYGGIRGTLVHIFGGEKIWLDRWRQKPTSSLVKEDELPSLQHLREVWQSLRSELDAFIRSVPEEKLQDRLQYRDTKGNLYNSVLANQIQHRINHSTFHRGQVITLLRQLGAKPPTTDFIVFCHQKDGEE